MPGPYHKCPQSKYKYKNPQRRSAPGTSAHGPRPTSTRNTATQQSRRSPRATAPYTLSEPRSPAWHARLHGPCTPFGLGQRCAGGVRPGGFFPGRSPSSTVTASVSITGGAAAKSALTNLVDRKRLKGKRGRRGSSGLRWRGMRFSVKSSLSTA